MGMGHHAAADEMVRRLGERGLVARRIDVLALDRSGRGGRLRRFYAFLLRRLPWVYDLSMQAWERWPEPFERLTARGAAAYEEALLREIARFRPDVVASVYNLATQALGRLRAAGRLDVPVAGYVTDPGAHPYWVHPAVDLNVALSTSAARALEGFGAAATVVAPPLVAPEFRDGTRGRTEARARLGIPEGSRVALVSSGSWASSSVERTVRALARVRGVLPLVLCGRNAALRERLTKRGEGIALGWTGDVAGVMAAADVLVDNAGGMTCWEALCSGLPVVLVRPLPGHGRLNARALEQEGLAAYARTDEELTALVRALSRRSPDAPRSVEAAFDGDPVAPLLATLFPAGRGAA